MRKVLIISYFYPPCNLTASQRVFAFVKYLSEYGYYPIVVSRNWEEAIKTQADISKPSGKETIHVKQEGNEIYYLPFKGSRRDQFLTKYGPDRFTSFRRLLTFFELLLENFGIFSKSNMSLYHQAKKLIKEENISVLLISANPFWQFYFGFLLKKKYPKIKWIADYRDDWTTGKLGKRNDWANRILKTLSKRNEKKWLQRADLITSVSDVLSKRIGKYVGKPSETIANGFFDELMNVSSRKSSQDVFVISYTGYLYGEQKVEWFINALKKVIEKHKEHIYIKVQFIGSAYEVNVEKRIRKLMEGYEDNLIITERTSKEETIAIEANSDLLLMVAYRDFQGIPGSKLYQYLGNKKPIFLCPTDNDIVEEILKETGVGIVSYSENDAFEKLNSLVEKHLKGEELIPPINDKLILSYSRRQQIKKLAKAIGLL